MLYNGKDMNLQQYMEERENEFRRNYGKNADWESSEEIIWSVQEYISSCGPLDGEDREWLRSYDPELLNLDDSNEDGESEETPEETPKDNFGVGEGERLMVKMEGKSPLAVFPDIPWSIDAGLVTGWSPTDGEHVPVEMKYAESLPDAPKVTAIEVMRQLHEEGYKQLMLIS